MEFLNEKILNDALLSVIQYAPKIALAIITLVIGLWIVNQVTNLIRRKLDNSKVDKTLTPFLISLFSTLAKVMLLISVASILGVETTSFVAILGAAGLAVGLALQGSLSNFAGGVLILILRPFKPEDLIQAQGHLGFVREIQILVTKIYTMDNEEVIIPNGPLAAGIIENFSSITYRRLKINFIIGYNNDLENVRKILIDLTKSNENILQKEEASIAIPHGEAPSVTYTLNEFTVSVSLRMWVRPEDYLNVQANMSEKIHAKISNGINGPRPARDIFMHNMN